MQVMAIEALQRRPDVIARPDMAEKKLRSSQGATGAAKQSAETRLVC